MQIKKSKRSTQNHKIVEQDKIHGRDVLPVTKLKTKTKIKQKQNKQNNYKNTGSWEQTIEMTLSCTTAPTPECFALESSYQNI